MADPADSEDLDAAIGLLARTISGSLDELRRTGITWIPRPGPAPAPAAAAARPPAPRENVDLPPMPPPPDTTPARDPLPVVDAPSAQETASAIAALLAEDLPAEDKLARLENDVITPGCARCKLHRGRSKLVYGVGNPQADLVFVGEGPGGEEDRQGIPFVGNAGQLLTKMIGAMGFERDDVYICNVVKCRPPNNRDPEPDEVEACEPFLKAQLSVLQPKVIVALGRYASQCLLRKNTPIGRLRGNWHVYEGVDLMPTFHPAYLLRSPEKKREAWQDLQDVMKRFGKAPGN
jgi:DNA polymerase